ncbi:MAG: hypothetical protein GY737_28140 [Desulfobacteraceae bacterium]|nr:hypothetical protein [Desulfobacteraceae bacterium]
MKSKGLWGLIIAISILAIAVIYGVEHPPLLNEASEPDINDTPQPTETVKAVTIVYSYEADFWVTIAEDRGVTAAFADNNHIENKNLTVTRIHMDTKTVNKSPEKMAGITPGIIAQIKRTKPDVVLLFDDNAAKFIGAELLHSDLPVVFGSVNASPADTDYTRAGALADSLEIPGHNITGVLERMPVLAGFEIMGTLNPKARTAALISDDSTTARAIVETMGGLEALDRAALTVQARLFTNDFEELKAFVQDQQDKVDALAILVGYTMRNARGQPVSQEQIVRWLLMNSRIPGISYSEVLGAEGFLLTVAVDLEKQGYHAGLMGVRILGGAQPAKMPIIDPVAKKIVINLARAEQLGMDVPMSLLKRASQVHRKMSLYPEYGETGK